MRVMFAGSPAPAVPVLAALLDSPHEVALVITREDRPRGRSRTPVPTPVGDVAAEEGLPLLKPASINAPEALQVMRDADAGADTYTQSARLTEVVIQYTESSTEAAAW